MTSNFLSGQLKNRARACYNRYFKRINSFKSQETSFFVLNEENLGSPGVQKITRKILKHHGKVVSFQDLHNPERGGPYRAVQVLVVADDIFNAVDYYLAQQCPVFKQVGTRRKRPSTTYDPKPLFEWLMQPLHEIMNMRMVDKLTDYWACSEPEWHLVRALKVPGLASTNYELLSRQQKQQLAQSIQTQVFCLASKEERLDRQQQRTFKAEGHLFTLKDPQEARRGMDFPLYNSDAPIGTSVFQFAAEHKYAAENHDELVKKFKANLAKQVQEAEHNDVQDL